MVVAKLLILGSQCVLISFKLNLRIGSGECLAGGGRDVMGVLQSKYNLSTKTTTPFLLIRNMFVRSMRMKLVEN